MLESGRLRQEYTAARRRTDILLVGHVTHDLIGGPQDGSYRLGGTVSFGATTALRLGRRPAIVTRAASPADVAELPPGVEVHLLPSPTTTTFANVYTPQGRIQHCYTPAPPIGADDIPHAARHPSAVLLGPLVNEIGPDVARLFGADSLVAAVPQGWMRRWDANGRVYHVPWQNAAEFLPHIDVLILSLEDIDGDLSRLEPYFEHIRLIVVTEYRDGSTIYQKRGDGSTGQVKIPPRPAVEVDPTGAGDIFATAFMIRLQELGDPIQAARFANVTASFGVEAVGITGVPSRQHVLDYMQAHPFVPGDPTSAAETAAL